MRSKSINANKPNLWKPDVAASVDQLNQWFMQFAPQAFRATRVKTAEHVKAALVATQDLRTLDCAALRANPGSLPTLRMCTAPPLAADRLIGLAGASKSLIGSMEEGRLASRMKAELLEEKLDKGLPCTDQAARPGHIPMVGREHGTDGPRTRSGIHDCRRPSM